MKKLSSILALFSLALVFFTGSASANIKEMVLCLPGFPGTESQARPYLKEMLRYLETRLESEPGSMNGIYLPDGEDAESALEEKKPGVALVGPSVYVGQHKALGMKVIAKVEANGRGEETYSVVTRKDGPARLADLAGKTMEGAVVHDAKYVHNVLLDRALEIGKLTLKSQKRPLTALRNVARGKVDAAIIDESVREHMPELSVASELRVIFTSKPVPPPAVVVMGEGHKHAAKLKNVLVGLCQKPEGRELCKTLTISSIKAASDKDYKQLLKSYDR